MREGGERGRERGERGRGRERERPSLFWFTPLIFATVRIEPGQDYEPGFHLGLLKHLEHLPLLSQGTLAGIWIRSEASDTRIGACLRCWCCGWQLNSQNHNDGTISFFLFNQILAK